VALVVSGRSGQSEEGEQGAVRRGQPEGRRASGQWVGYEIAIP